MKAPLILKKSKLNAHFLSAQHAIQTGAIDVLQAILLEYPALANWRELPDSNGIQNTLLHYATGWQETNWPENAAKAAQILIQKGALVDAENHLVKGETPLHYAAIANNIDVLQILLQAGAKTEARGKFHHTIDTVLGYALFFGKTNLNNHLNKVCIDTLIRHHARIYLPFAAALNDIKAVKKHFRPDHTLVSNAGIGNSHTILQQAFLFACRFGHIEICEHLIYRGVNINAKVPFFQYHATGLHLACVSGQQRQIVRFLLNCGADPNITDTYYNATPKGWAMFFGQDQVFGLFS